MRYIRNNPDHVKEGLKNRGVDLSVDELLQLDSVWREKLTETEKLKAERNEVSDQIGAAKRAGEDASPALERMKAVSARIKDLDKEVNDTEEKIQRFMLEIPNIPHESVPIGKSDDDNVEVRKYGEPPSFDFEPKAHWDLGVNLKMLDFERAGKITGARFSAFTGIGARLERALIQFMLDVHTEKHHYKELATSAIANTASMTSTGQIPKFSEDMFRLAETDYYLIPTAEVPITNWHREEILDGEALPKRYVGYTPCFRAEAGAHGRDTRGLIRNHQFDKVELVKLTHPDHSYDELEKLTADAETVLQKLGLAYRVVVLSTGDLGFSAAKTYDIEVWMPSYDRYVEISSCSNFEDFQSRRAQIRFREKQGSKAEFVHTLNGSGLAVGRTFAALIENFQQSDGSVVIPEVLRPYVGGLDRIS